MEDKNKGEFSLDLTSLPVSKSLSLSYSTKENLVSQPIFEPMLHENCEEPKNYEEVTNSALENVRFSKSKVFSRRKTENPDSLQAQDSTRILEIR